MTARLIKGMYGSEFNRKESVFGLQCGQMRGEGKIGHNSGWYNRAGEKLGWGDMSVKDALTIRQQLQGNERFVLLYENDSFWNFVTRNKGSIGADCETAPDADAPGIEYVAEKFYLIIAPGRAFYVDRYGDKAPGTRIARWSGLETTVVDRAMAERILRTDWLPD